MTKKMKIILGVVAAAAIVAGAYTYRATHVTSSPEAQEVEEAEILNPVVSACNADLVFSYC